MLQKKFTKVLLNKYVNNTKILLFFIVLFGLALRLLFFTGIGSSDSVFYTKFAYDISTNSLDFSEGHFTSRIGLLIPVSIIFAIFGVNELTSNILPLLISLSSIILIYGFGKLLFNKRTGLIAAFMLSILPIDIIYATRLNTDFTSAFFIALGVYFFLKAERTKTSLLYIISGLSIGLAYLIKELSILIGLFFIAYVIYYKKIKVVYFLVPFGFLVIFSMGALYFYTETGNPLYQSINNADWSKEIIATNMYGRGNFPEGFFHYGWIIFTDFTVALFYVFSFIATFYLLIMRKKESYILLLWYIPILIYLSIGTANPTQYILIPAAARFLAIVNIPIILILAYFLAQNDIIIKKALLPSILAVLVVTSIGYVYISDNRLELNEIKKVITYLQSLPNKTIYTDERTELIFNYLIGYRSNNFKSFNNFEFLDSENTYALNLTSIHDSYIVVDQHTINVFISRKPNIVFPKEIFTVPDNWVVKKEIGKNPESSILVYYIE